jgi:hypothetical protein
LSIFVFLSQSNGDGLFKFLQNIEKGESF